MGPAGEVLGYCRPFIAVVEVETEQREIFLVDPARVPDARLEVVVVSAWA